MEKVDCLNIYFHVRYSTSSKTHLQIEATDIKKCCSNSNFQSVETVSEVNHELNMSFDIKTEKRDWKPIKNITGRLRNPNTKLNAYLITLINFKQNWVKITCEKQTLITKTGKTSEKFLHKFRFRS